MTGAVYAQTTKNLKIVFHVDSPNVQRVEMAFHNAHSVEMHTGTGKVRMVVVANGPAVKFFLRSTSSEIASQIHNLESTGDVRFHVCEASLKAFHYSPSDVLGDCKVVPAGVIDIARLEARGYAYIKP